MSKEQLQEALPRMSRNLYPENRIIEEDEEGDLALIEKMQGIKNKNQS